MASQIVVFFESIGDDIKAIGQDAEAVLTKLLGAAALAGLQTSAETLLKSDFGKVVLADAQTLLAQVKTGQISQVAAITSLAQMTIEAGRKTGIALESSIATALAALAIGKLSGALSEADPRSEAQKIADAASYAEMQEANKQRAEQTETSTESAAPPAAAAAPTTKVDTKPPAPAQKPQEAAAKPAPKGT